MTLMPPSLESQLPTTLSLLRGSLFGVRGFGCRVGVGPITLEELVSFVLIPNCVVVSLRFPNKTVGRTGASMSNGKI